MLLCDFGEVNKSFKSFDLAEEEPVLATGMSPVFKQAGGGTRHAEAVVLTPEFHAGANLIDKLVLLNAVLGPLCFKVELGFAFFARLNPVHQGDLDEPPRIVEALRVGRGHHVAGRPPPIHPGEEPVLAIVAPVFARLVEWRVDHGILYDDLFHDVGSARKNIASGKDLHEITYGSFRCNVRVRSTLLRDEGQCCGKIR